MSTTNIDFLNASEITLTIPKQYLERLYDLLRDNSHAGNSQGGDETKMQDRVQKMLQKREDREIMAYLEWILKQNH
jgi:hypothetical protein